MSYRHDPKKWMIAMMLICLTVIVFVAVFFALKPAVERFSLDFYYPALKSVRSLEDYAANQLLLAKSKTELARTVAVLQQENQQLSASLAAVNGLRSENEQLRIIAGLRPPTGFRTICSEILARDPATWLERFTIDKGENSGIQEGDLVVASVYSPSTQKYLTGAVGRIASVSHHSSVVVTLFCRECSIGVALAESGTFGVLGGDQNAGSGTAVVSCLPPDAKYGVGEIVLTSGFSEKIPAGIGLGILAAGSDGAPAVTLDANHLSASAVIKPILDFSHLRFVAVLSKDEPKK